MKKLSDLYDIDSDIIVKGIKINSKEVENGDIFVCTMGVNADRHDFIDDAIKNGACAIVVSKDVDKYDIPVIKVNNTNDELPILCSKFYDYPQDKLEIIGVTGTNGKTTTAEIIYQLIGDNCAYIGTNGKKYNNTEQSIRNTTPDIDRLIPYFSEFINSNCTSVCMETSSEAFYRHRLDSIKFDIAIFTNITQDHLNIHKTIENYVDCKCQLFRQVKDNGFSILNSDDKYFETVKACSKGNILTYGFNNDSNLVIKEYKELTNGTNIIFEYEGKSYDVKSPLLGVFNVYNLMAAILVCLCKKMNMVDILKKIEKLKSIKGRMEILPFTKEYMVVLDYAHTPDALDKILTYANKIKKNRIITVTGSAGGREKEKRASMGKVVLEKSDYVIFTMDDPRNEDVNVIIDELVGMSKNTNYERIIDRKEAIFKALSIAQDDDIILIVGKGRDNYMALGNEYVPYCDYDVIKEFFNN